MKIILLTITALIFSGCSTQSTSATNQIMIFSFIKENNVTMISSNKGLLKTNTAIIKNWPFEDLFCDNCSSTEKEFFTPSGPEKRVTIYDKEDKLIALAIESHLKNIKINDFNFFHTKDNIIKVCNKEKCINIKPYEEVTLSNCNIVLTNYIYTSAKKGIADSEQQVFQAAIFCK